MATRRGKLGKAIILTEREREMILRCLAYVECGEWPWTWDNDGVTTPSAEARERKAVATAKAKLEAL